VSACKITGPCFKETINSSNYIPLIRTPLSTELTEEEKMYSYLMQLCATPHTAYGSRFEST